MSTIRTNPARWTGLGLVLSLMVAASVLNGCQRASRKAPADQAPDVRVTLVVEPAPPAVGDARVVVQLADASGKPIDGAAVNVRGDMSHAGMQPVLATAAEETGGAYAADFEWTMAGDWIVTVTAVLPDGRTATRQFDLTVQKP
jgi:nitrogen fixation protein FixH